MNISQHELIQLLKKQVHEEFFEQPLPLATAKDLLEAEQFFGFELPEFLKLLYSQVGNGGFGPEYGFVGLPGGEHYEGGWDLLELNSHLRANNFERKAINMIYWGCSEYFMVSCEDQNLPVLYKAFDPMGEAYSYKTVRPSLETYLYDWVTGKDVAWVEP